MGVANDGIKLIVYLATATTIVTLVATLMYAAQQTQHFRLPNDVWISDQLVEKTELVEVPASLHELQTRRLPHQHVVHSQTPTLFKDSVIPGRKNGGYIVTLSFGPVDQHGVGLCSVQRQQCWMKSYDYNVHIVEPFAAASHLESSPKYWNIVDSGGTVLRFGDFFDTNYYHSLMRKLNVPDIVRWEEFVQNAPRNVIAVTIDGNIGYDKRCYGLIRYDDRACGHDRHSQIDRSGCNTAEEINEAMSYLNKRHGFKLLRHVCINCKHSSWSVYSPQDITKYIFGDDPPSNVTIVMNVWYFLISLVPNCETGKHCASFDFKQFQPSSRLHLDAKRYLKEVLNTSSISVAIMFRTERMFKELSPKEVLERMDSVPKLYNDKNSSLSFSGKPLLTIDIGSYGSDSIGNTPEYMGHYDEVVAKFEHLLSVMYPRGQRWTLSEYEQGFSTIVGSTDRGYISALQRELASHAECLMLYPGKGHYQRLVEFNYKDNHPQSSYCIQHL